MEGLPGLLLILGIFAYFYSKGSDSASKTQNYTHSNPLPIAKPTVEYTPNSTTGEFARSSEGFIPTDRCECGGEWVKHVNKVNGGRFFGCSRYPRCENTRDKQKAKYFCGNGHKRTIENTSYSADGGRRCLICRPFPETSSSDDSLYSPFCRNGHLRTDADTYVRPSGERECNICRKNNRPLSSGSSSSSSSDTDLFCRNGHLRTDEDTYVRPDGERECRICRKIARQ